MVKHIGIATVSAEGAALCYRTICMEGAALHRDSVAHRRSRFTAPDLRLDPIIGPSGSARGNAQWWRNRDSG